MGRARDGVEDGVGHVLGGQLAHGFGVGVEGCLGWTSTAMWSRSSVAAMPGEITVTRMLSFVDLLAQRSWLAPSTPNLVAEQAAASWVGDTGRRSRRC